MQVILERCKNRTATRIGRSRPVGGQGPATTARQMARSTLPSSQRYFITANDIREAAGVLGFDTPSDFVRAYPMSREWLTLLSRRMDAVAAVYRMAA